MSFLSAISRGARRALSTARITDLLPGSGLLTVRLKDLSEGQITTCISALASQRHPAPRVIVTEIDGPGALLLVAVLAIHRRKISEIIVHPHDPSTPPFIRRVPPPSNKLLIETSATKIANLAAQKASLILHTELSTE